MKLIGPTLVLVLFLSTACGTEEVDGTVRYAVSGIATAGPTCPVITDPPDPACADRPVPGAELAITDATGATVASVSTDAAGRYSVELAVGNYLITPQPVDGLLGTAEAVEVTVVDRAVEVDFEYDTGMR